MACPFSIEPCLRGTISNMETLKEVTWNVNGDLIPRFDTLRWISIRYRRILPLSVMKRYQCIVVGAAPGRLTVAITDQRDTSVIALISRSTARTIFPVLIHPVKMRLLIHRIERDERYQRNTQRRPYYQNRCQIHLMV